MCKPPKEKTMHSSLSQENPSKISQSGSHPAEKPGSGSKGSKDDSLTKSRKKDVCSQCNKKIRVKKMAPITRIAFGIFFFFAGLIQMGLAAGHIIISKKPNVFKSIYSEQLVVTSSAVIIISVLKSIAGVLFATICPNSKMIAFILSMALSILTLTNVGGTFFSLFVYFLQDEYYLCFIVLPSVLWFLVSVVPFIYSLVTLNALCQCSAKEKKVDSDAAKDSESNIAFDIVTKENKEEPKQCSTDQTMNPSHEEIHEDRSHYDPGDASTKPPVTKQGSKTNTKKTEPVLPDQPLQMEEGYENIGTDMGGGNTEVTVYDNVEDSEKVPNFRRAPSKGMATAVRTKARRMPSKNDEDGGKKRIVTAIEAKRPATAIEKKRSGTALEKNVMPRKLATALEKKRSLTALEKKKSLTALEKKKSATALEKKVAVRKMATAVPRKKATIVSTYLNN